MEIVLQLETKELSRLKDILLKDDKVSRASITFKDGGIIQKQGYFCLISGTEEQCKHAIAICKDFAKEADAKDRDNVIKKIKEEEQKASEGLGGIFG